MKLEPGTAIGAYEVLRPLGEGGMGSVYEARHTALGKLVAIKIMAPEYAADEQLLARFVREGRAACSIDHPNVVTVLDVGVHGKTPYLVMELLRGQDLGAHLAEKHTLGVEEAVRIVIPICAALQAAHDAGIIHRDMKPENVFLSRTPLGTIEPKVVDFGIAKLGTNKGLTSTRDMMGSPFYMSPEHFHGAAMVVPQSDQYAVALILYQALAGRRPFEQDSVLSLMHAITTGIFSPLDVEVPGLPAGLATVVHKAMHLRASERYPTCMHLAQALLPFADAETRARWTRIVEGAVGEMAAIDATPSASAPSKGAGAPSAAGTAGVTTGPLDLGRGALVVEATGAGTPSTAGLAASTPVVASGATAAGVSRRPLGLAAVGLGLAAVLGLALAGLSRGSPPEAPAPPSVSTIRVEVRAEPAHATFILDGAPQGRGPLVTDVTASAPHHLRVEADGFVPTELHFQGAPPPSVLTLTALPSVVGTTSASGEGPELGATVGVPTTPPATDERTTLRATLPSVGEPSSSPHARGRRGTSATEPSPQPPPTRTEPSPTRTEPSERTGGRTERGINGAAILD
jgi:serine/threonine-protein kinase